MVLFINGFLAGLDLERKPSSINRIIRERKEK